MTSSVAEIGFCCVHVTGLPKVPEDLLSDNDYEAAFTRWLARTGDEENDDADAEGNAPFVSLRVVREKETGLCRGYGFLSFLNRQEGERSIEILNNLSGKKKDEVTPPTTESEPVVRLASPANLEDAGETSGASGVKQKSTATENDDKSNDTSASIEKTLALWKQQPESPTTISFPELLAQFAVEKPPKPPSGKNKNANSKNNTTKNPEDLPHIRLGRKKYPSKRKHADSVTCSDKSKTVVDAKGFVVFKKGSSAKTLVERAEEKKRLGGG